jgi:hypothetical protein
MVQYSKIRQRYTIGMNKYVYKYEIVDNTRDRAICYCTSKEEAIIIKKALDMLCKNVHVKEPKR